MELREQIARAIHGQCDRELDASWGDWLPEADAVLELLAQQKPVAWMSPGRERLEWVRSDTVFGSHTVPLYAEPVAQDTVPDGWQLVPEDLTPEMVRAMEQQWMCGSQIDMAKREWTAALAAAPKQEDR